MGTFDNNRAALDEAYRTSEDRMAILLDGQAPMAPAPAAGKPVEAASPAKPPQDTGPGFWARLSTGIGSAASRAADLVDDLASRVEVSLPISGARVNAAVQATAPPREPRWGMILGAAAAAVALLALLTRRA